MLSTARRWVPVAVGLLVFAIALRVLRTELHGVSWHQLSADIARVRPSSLGLALVLTALNYAVLTGYDFLAFAYIGKRLPAAQVALASFLSYAVANNVGFAMLSGASVRYRFYTRWGLTGEELSRIVFSYSVTFWLGLLALGGISLARQPGARPLGAMRGAASRRRSGWLLAAPRVGVRRRCRHRRAADPHRPLPAFRCRRRSIAVTQLALSVVDWALAGAVLYVLLPAGRPCRSWRSSARSSPRICSALASHVPGGARRVRGADGPAAQAVPAIRRAAAGAGRLPRRLLPAAARRRAGRARRSTSCTSAARRRRGSTRGARPADRAAHAAAVRVC